MLNRIWALMLLGMLFLSWGCAEPTGTVIPLHDMEFVQSEQNLSPVDLSVTRISGPSSLSLGASWELVARASDPEGSPVHYRWSATSGTLSAEEGAQVEWTATESVGRAEVIIEAIDRMGNITRAAFAVSVPYNLPGAAPAGPVEDIRDAVGYNCSLGIDGNDQPHIAYLNGTHPSLKYATYDGGQWIIETIEGYGLDIGGAAGYDASLALDSTGQVHISYLVDYAENDRPVLNYATRSAGIWNVVTVDGAADEGHFNTTLKINPVTDLPEIIYQADGAVEKASVVRHATCVGNCLLDTSWSKYTLHEETRGTYSDDNRAYAGGFAISADGTRHVTIGARYDDSNGTDWAELIYGVRAGADWDMTERLIPLDYDTYYHNDEDANRLVLDRNGQPLVLHRDGIYHRTAAGEWNLSEVESGDIDDTSNYARFDIACDVSSNQPVSGVVWMTVPHSGVELVKTNERGYFEYTYLGSLDSSSSTRTSIALDSTGGAHLCWMDDANLMYQ